LLLAEAMHSDECPLDQVEKGGHNTLRKLLHCTARQIVITADPHTLTISALLLDRFFSSACNVTALAWTVSNSVLCAVATCRIDDGVGI